MSATSKMATSRHKYATRLATRTDAEDDIADQFNGAMAARKSVIDSPREQITAADVTKQKKDMVLQIGVELSSILSAMTSSEDVSSVSASRVRDASRERSRPNITAVTDKSIQKAEKSKALPDGLPPLSPQVNATIGSPSHKLVQLTSTPAKTGTTPLFRMKSIPNVQDVFTRKKDYSSEDEPVFDKTQATRRYGLVLEKHMAEVKRDMSKLRTEMQLKFDALHSLMQNLCTKFDDAGQRAYSRTQDSRTGRSSHGSDFTSVSHQRTSSWVADSTRALKANSQLTTDDTEDGPINSDDASDALNPTVVTEATSHTVQSSHHSKQVKGKTNEETKTAVSADIDINAVQSKKAITRSIKDGSQITDVRQGRNREKVGAKSSVYHTPKSPTPMKKTNREDRSFSRDRSNSRSRSKSCVVRYSAVKIRPYNGDPFVKQYLTQFEVTAKLAGWPKTEWGSRLLTALEGKARSVLNLKPLSTSPSYEKVSALLKQAFAPEAKESVWLQELEGLKREAKETVTQLGHRIRLIMVKAFPRLELTERSRIAVGYFSRALANDRQQDAIGTAQCQTLEDAIEVAISLDYRRQPDENRRDRRSDRVRVISDKEEPNNPLDSFLGRGWVKSRNRGGGRGRDRRQGSQSHVQVVGHGQDTAQAIAALTDRMEALSTQMSQLCGSANLHSVPGQSVERPRPRDRATNNNPAVCFNCNSPDHFIRDCPQPRQTFQNRENDRGQRTTGQSRGQTVSSQ